jgi:hypothetical protein
MVIVNLKKIDAIPNDTHLIKSNDILNVLKGLKKIIY